MKVMNIEKQKLVNYIKKLSEAKILVVGDIAIDEMVYGDTERISRESFILPILKRLSPLKTIAFAS